MKTAELADAVERRENPLPALAVPVIMEVINELIERLRKRESLRKRMDTLEAIVRAQAAAIAQLQAQG